MPTRKKSARQYSAGMHSVSTLDSVRLDRWLWAARFYKTRALATEAVNGGKVKVNGARARPAKLLKSGFEIKIRTAAFEQVIIVQAMSHRRGSAQMAAKLYQETEVSIAAHEKIRLALGSLPRPEMGRPSKKQRREVIRHKRQV